MAIAQQECIKKTDEQLVVLTLKNPDYYLCLMKRYESKLLNYIIKISNMNKEDAEDTLQEIFIKTYRNLNEFDINFKFSSWLYRIAHNTAISFFRKKKTSLQTFSWEEKDLNNIFKSPLNLENTNIQKLTYQQILKIINSLPLKYKEILILKFFEDKDYREISDILHKPMGTVATLINRAKISLRQELKKEGIEL